MRKADAISILASHGQELRERGVQAVFLFGSVARDEATETSDIDLLVELDPEHQVGIFAFMELKRYLEGILGLPVDLVTRDALKRQFQAQILAEAIRAA